MFKNAVSKIKQDVSTGMQLNFSMRTTSVFPNMAIQMTAIGEESGSLDEMLSKVASYYEEEVDNAVDNLTTLMEPMIMAVLRRTGWRSDRGHVPSDLPTRQRRRITDALLDYLASHPLAFVLCAILLGLLVGSFLQRRRASPAEDDGAQLEGRSPRSARAGAGTQAGDLQPGAAEFGVPALRPRDPPWENIPLVSYLALGGKCSSCKAAIGKRYPWWNWPPRCFPATSPGISASPGRRARCSC